MQPNYDFIVLIKEITFCSVSWAWRQVTSHRE